MLTTNGTNVPSVLPPPQASHATLCSLREQHPHPLRHHPPSLLDESIFEDIPLAAPPSALTSTSPHYDHQDLLLEHPRPSGRGHQRSLTDTLFENCRPLVTKASSTLQQSRTSLHSPTKSLASFLPSRAANSPSGATQASSRSRNPKLFGDWFSGTSAPVNIGVARPTPEKEPGEEEPMDLLSRYAPRPPVMLTRNVNASSTSAAAADAAASKPASKFAWFSKSAAPAPPNRTPTITAPLDELLTLNPSTALFPHGPPDPLAPSSFHDLLDTAEQLVKRFQAAYRDNLITLTDVRAEASATSDELAEAETRAQHLKLQLDEMSEQVSGRDKAIKALGEELVEEKRRRAEEQEARARSVRLVRSHRQLRGKKSVSGLGIHEDRHYLTRSSGSDSGFESDASSVFSRPSTSDGMSPSATSVSTFASEEEIDAADPDAETGTVIHHPIGNRDFSTATVRPGLVSRRSTYDLVLDEMHHGCSNRSSESLAFGECSCCNSEQHTMPIAQWESESGTVSAKQADLLNENAALRKRVEELEDTVQGCLDLVGGLVR